MCHRANRSLLGLVFVVMCLAACATRAGTPGADAVLVSTLEVSLTSGAAALPRGSELELKLYEQGPLARVFALTHGEDWPAGATRLIRVHLDRPLDPRRVRRYSLALRGPATGPGAWDVESAFVEWEVNGERQRLLAATLAGAVAPDRELASEELRDAQLRCTADADCDDGRTCNGTERCEPRSRLADARGCVSGRPVICPVNQVCVEQAGCRGLKDAAAR